MPPPPSKGSDDSNNNKNDDDASSTIQDISGLSDGETIHLVPRIVSVNHNNLTDNNNTTSSSTNNVGSNNSNRSTATTNNNNKSTVGGGDDGTTAAALLGGILSGLGPDNTTATNGRSSSSSSSGTANVTSLSEGDGMSLLAALLGLGSVANSSSSTSSSNNNNNNNNNNSGGEGTNRNSGLGGIVSRAAMMGILDDNVGGGPNTVSSASPLLAVVRSATTNSGSQRTTRSATTSSGGEATATTTSSRSPSTTTANTGLSSRSLDGIRSTPNNSNRNNATATSPNATTTTTTTSGSSSAAIRAARNRRRATAARLTASDIRIPDPGSLEPVRQGLLTLHTLLGNAQLNLNQQQQLQSEQQMMEDDLTSNTRLDHPHPLNSHRQWYRGQWLDALDTVNQWLEATIVDVALPSDVLGNYYATSRSNSSSSSSSSSSSRSNGRRHHDGNRPVEEVVGRNDLEGRRRLLLEPRPNTTPDDDEGDNGIMGVVYDLLSPRPRDDNDGVQLLLIHYNGWPHRWDEWIRSDSPRIRPFRTRTRHRVMSTHASPTPQAVFQMSPSTGIGGRGDEESSEDVERARLLPELLRVLSSVNSVLSSALPSGEASSSSSLVGNDSVTVNNSSHLPWHSSNQGSGQFQSTANEVEHGDDADEMSDGEYYNASETTSSSHRQRPDPLSQLNASQLRQLAPLIDRLGRTLTDAAPHIASLADSLPRSPPLPQARAVPPRLNGSESFAAQASQLYFGINSEDGNDGQSEPVNNPSAPNTDAQVVAVETAVDPDLTDFVNGMVNTTRGGSSRDSSREPNTSSLLASYLSSIGVGGGNPGSGGGGGGGGGGGENGESPRVVRVGGGDGGLFSASGGGGNGPGIDIHIHAIVTGPGMTPPGLGGFGIGGGITQTNINNANASAPVTATPVSQQRNNNDSGMDSEEIDLFSDLYSESPAPVNLHQGDQDDDDDGNCDNLNQAFEECRSIEEESDSSIESVGNQSSDGKVVASNDEETGTALGGIAASTNSELPFGSNGANEGDATIQDVPPIDARTPPASPSRRRSSASFGSRMYRRTFGRLTGSSRRSN